MNIRNKIRDTISNLRQLEGQYKDKVQSGSKDMSDYLELNYLSGVGNGLNFVFKLQENEISEENYKNLEKQLLHQEKAN